MITTARPAAPIRHEEAAELATGAYDRLLGLLDALDPADWSRPTDCTGWDVAAMVAHMVGAAKGHASVREMARQGLHGFRHRADFDGNQLDAMNHLQVREHAHLSPGELVAELRRVAPVAVRERMRLPRPLRRIPLPTGAGTGSVEKGLPGKVTLGHLNDVILTRDVFLHRVDIARATDRDPVPDDTIDRRIVEDVVAEWAATHGEPFQLELTGPAGGAYAAGDGGPDLSFDAFEFCRIVSGRARGEGLLATPVLF